VAHSRIRMNRQPPPDADNGRPDAHAPAASAEPASRPIAEPEPNGSTQARSAGGNTDGKARRRGRPARRGLKDWRLRSRLLLLIAIPTLTAVVLGGLRIASAVQSALAFQRAEERAVLADNMGQLAQRLETERDETVYYIALGSGGRAGDLAKPANSGAVQQYQVIQAFYRKTDRAIGQFRALYAQYRPAYSAAGQQRVSAALTGLNDLPYLRQASTKTLLYPLAVLQKYTNLVDSLIVIDDQTAQGTGDPVLSQTAEALGLVARIQEESSEQRAILSAALQQGTLGTEETSALDAAQVNQQDDQQNFDLTATERQREQWNNAVSGSFVYLAASEEQQAEALQARARSLSSDPLTAAGFYDAMTDGLNRMGSVERALATAAITRANSLRGSAVTFAILVGIAVVALLALAVTLIGVVGRSLVSPLRRLRAGALEVAGVRLPETVRRMSEGEGADAPLEVEPINVDSTDEIGEVARAFDQVHREAVRLASNEAALRGNVNAMFVNLSRRSQSLVERQIRLIDDLEQGEQDSERLGNLFQMDHLATRMRRNSENLLVLAGHDVSRRRTQSVPLVDVVRAAVSEIEQYERITVDIQAGIAVRGQVVNDVVHLLAELVENATSFSAAGTTVSVTGYAVNTGGVLLDITDQGVGMGAEEMAHANWRLDNPPVVDVAVSRRMGLFVVARLAARHGIRVRLRPASMGGLTALVWLPDEVVSQGMEAPVTPGTHRFDALSPVAQAVPPMAPEEPSVATETPAGAGGASRSTARLPRQGDIIAVPVTDSGNGTAAVPEETAAEGGSNGDGAPASDEPTPEQQYAAAPPAMSAEDTIRLPIFESVESDWFRRSRHSGDRLVPVPSAAAWSSPADQGWRAAEVAVSPVSDGVTGAGLPKRVPKANLVPGTVSTAAAAPPAPAPRSAATARERLARYQQGVREARAAAQDDDGEASHDQDSAT
jgi:signal transduction histidine kinase